MSRPAFNDPALQEIYQDLLDCGMDEIGANELVRCAIEDSDYEDEPPDEPDTLANLGLSEADFR